MTKWLSKRIHRTNWNKCAAGFGSLKVDLNSQVRLCTAPHRSLQLSSSIDQSMGNVFLSFTTLLIESKCKKDSVHHQCCLPIRSKLSHLLPANYRISISGTLSTTIFCHRVHYFSVSPARNLAFH